MEINFLLSVVFSLDMILFFHSYTEKNDFTEISTNLARYRSDNNFVGLSK